MADSKPAVQSEDQLHAMRHSMAHILATAVQELYPGVKFGVGPVIENGFYYDFDLADTITPDDLPKIEAKMIEIIKAAYLFEHQDLPIDEAIDYFKKPKQPYKVELLHDLKTHGTTVAKDIDHEQLGIEKGEKITTVSLYKSGPFTDLCRGGHLETTKQAGAFKLTKISGAYWRGKADKAQMQRVYGVAFAEKAELNNYLAQQAEAEKRDHRKLGKELDLFTFSDLIGPGLPLFTPRGTVLRRQLDNFVQEMRDEYDYEEVSIPHITKKDAYIASGHWTKFADELFRITTREGHEFAMKPMNCPHHTQIYASRPRSYRELPVRYRETSTAYRDEQSGELFGLSRTRAFAQDDAHVFCRTSQIEEEVLKIWNIVERFYGVLNFDDLKVRFSRHDPTAMEAYSGSPEAWKAAEAQMKAIVEAKVGDDYLDGLGEAAFYGPKIDFIGRDAIGREWQVATIQLDFNQPEGFDLVCINEQSERERIVMIHAAIMGSIDRFLSIYIEHTAGNFPVWLAPEQVRLATVSDAPTIQKRAEAMRAELKAAGIRAVLDNSDESVGKKIREASVQKVPYTIVVGEKEVEGDEVSPRVRADLGGGEPKLSFESFISQVRDEIGQRSAQSNLG